MEDPDFEGEHGVDTYEPPADTAYEKARSRLYVLDNAPNVAYIFTKSMHEFLLEVQHWVRKGYYVGDTSAMVCNEQIQSCQLFKTLV